MNHRRYVVIWTIAAVLFGAVDVTSATGTGGAPPFLTKGLCGPIWAWGIALLAPVDTMQNAISRVMNKWSGNGR